ncbi:MAG TPA: BadF/BadG/BcrA/BcrD ATPase family protein [Ktedonobacterales bacterium]|jgi:N-acetylglucosamine kinase-like BadF-type ATPase
MTHQGTQDQAGPYFLGVDGGASKTLAIVVDAQGRECGRGVAGSSNYAAVGLGQALTQLHLAIEQATKQSECQRPFGAAWLGMAGVDRPEDTALLLPHLQTLAGTIRLTNDAELLLSAFDRAIGVALIAGTGSIALGRDRHSATTRAGGWGHILGDEGSGYEIGRQALQAAARSADGRGPATSLLERILQHWGLQRPDDLFEQVYQKTEKADIARLSSLVFAAAQTGDRPASKIIQLAAEELALAALTVCRALDFPDGPVPLALGGGLLIQEVGFRWQVLRRIRRQRPVQSVLVEQPALSAARAAITLLAKSEQINSPAT